MSSQLAPLLACFFFSILGLTSSGLIGMHSLPHWLVAPIMRFQAVGHHSADSGSDDGAEPAGPESVLVKRLRKVDAAREPAKAHALHAAIGNILRASGTQSKQALQHFEAARDAAVNAGDKDKMMTAYIDVAEAYIEEGRALDSQKELVSASGVLPDHFMDHRSKLNRGRGHAKFELWRTESALRYFEEAHKTAVEPEDKVLAMCDIAMAQACLGQADKSLKLLQQALEVVHASRKAGMQDLLCNKLAAEVHFRFAEAYHSAQNVAFAKAHYTKALRLQEKSPSIKAQRASAIKLGLANLEQGTGPELRCPKRPAAPWDTMKGPPLKMKDATFIEKINHLLTEQKYDMAEKELKSGLSTHSRPYKNLEAATALNILGNLYRKQSNFIKAAKQFRQALHAAIVCCGARNEEARTAYEGLRDVKVELPYDDQRVAAAAIERYFDILDPSRLSLDGPDESGGSLHIV